MDAKVFPAWAMKSHMPFLSGDTLLFSAAGEPLRQTFANGGTIWDRLQNDPRLAQRLLQKADWLGAGDEKPTRAAGRDVPVPFLQQPEVAARFEKLRTSTVAQRIWKLYYCQWSDTHPMQPKRLHTGLPDTAIECSPSFYRQKKQIFVSFIGGVRTVSGGGQGGERYEYRLYTMSGPSLETLASATAAMEETTWAGFVGERYTCFCRGPQIVLVSRKDGERTTLDCPLARVLRVSYRADDPESLIVTGMASPGRTVTLLYHLGSGETQEICAGGATAYKPTLFGDRVIFADRAGSGREDRQLHHGSYELMPTARAIRRHRRRVPA